ncbi:hypothetical protein FrCorBMG51_24050 [Protofrankia coriariae]|uniref:Uncharacterized protein n=2 Tax=Frankiaceae TaxID=74712 RepID=A0ABR5EYN6_9ACTN|nr:hypothetical protein FrCorBMG51_24050 [Protofrankia coriariae]
MLLVERAEASRVKVRLVKDPVTQALEDAWALVRTRSLPAAARTHVLPSCHRPPGRPATQSSPAARAASRENGGAAYRPPAVSSSAGARRVVVLPVPRRGVDGEGVDGETAQLIDEPWYLG